MYEVLSFVSWYGDEHGAMSRLCACPFGDLELSRRKGGPSRQFHLDLCSTKLVEKEYLKVWLYLGRLHLWLCLVAMLEKRLYMANSTSMPS